MKISFAIIAFLTVVCLKAQNKSSRVLVDTIKPANLSPYGQIDLEQFGVDPGKPDNSPYLQAAFNYVVSHNSQYTTLRVHSGHYRFLHSVLMYNYIASSNVYWPFTIILEGDNTYSSADGSGTVFDFSTLTNSFGIGIQGGKGCIIRGIKLIGAWHPPKLTPTEFYNSGYGTAPAGNCRNTRFSPSSAIVIDPFGPRVPSDGGYQGSDGSGNPLSSYYRGGMNGSTGIELSGIFFANWLIGLITSPNGGTFNAELLHAHHLQFQNVAYAVQGCQPEEKLNEVDHVECWGVTYLCFGTGMYGMGNPGNWHLHHWNIAGWVNIFVYNIQGGYFQSQFDHIYAENIGRLGYISSSIGTEFGESVFDFANYSDASYHYLNGQITGQGVHYVNDQFRYYGLYTPITINNLNGPNYFENTYFDAVPVYNTDYPLGNCYFSHCAVGGTSQLLNPAGPQEIDNTQLSNTFCYGNREILIKGLGTLKTTCARVAASLPINLNQKTYQLAPVEMPGTKTSPSRGGQMLVIPCNSDELHRVRKGDVLVAHNVKGIMVGVAGTITSIDSSAKTFVLGYVPKEIISGQNYALAVWLPLMNICFSGNTTAGSSQITGVKIIAGDLSRFILWGGLMQTNVFNCSQDAYQSHIMRITRWDPVNATLTIDRPCSKTQAAVIFVNTDARLEGL
jgi:hypothetical protein